MAPHAKIGYFVPQFPGQGHDNFWREVLALEQRGVVVVLFSTTPPPQPATDGWAAAATARTQYLRHNNPFAFLSALPALPPGEIIGAERGLWRDLSGALASARKLAQVAQALGVTHVHVQSCDRSALIAALSERLGGPSYSLTLHGPLSQFGPGQNFKWRGARFAMVASERLLAEVRTVLRDDAPRRVIVQALGVDTDVMRRDTPYAPPHKGEAIRLFTSGPLSAAKGLTDLVAAVRMLKDQGETASLEIAGADAEGAPGATAEVTASIAALGLGDHVRLLGSVSAAQLREGLCRAHLFVQASREEAIGPAMIEAMSCGVPTIGTAVGGVRELIRDGEDGVLVPPRDPATLARAIRYLAREPTRALALGAAGRARVIDRFTVHHTAEALMVEAGLIPRTDPDVF